jgi:predicted CopG family antitoxin
LCMSRDATNHIRVTAETWRQLNRRKQPGDSFEDVIQRLLEGEDESESAPQEETMKSDI